MKDFYIKNKKILNIVLMIVFSVGFFIVAKPIYALEVLDAAVTSILGWIAIAIVSVCGAILTNVIAAVISIAQYNDFIGNKQIIEAWVIIRDLCNMFFVLILLVIAFATILRIESYNVKKALPKLLIMAVLINFSRIIVGLFIDFSQVIMLTFVNAFADGGGNFVELMKVDQFLKFAKDTGDWKIDNSININSTVTGMLIAVLLIIISTIAMLAVLVVFVMRVIMLWIYVVLSPLAFLLSAFQGGQKYASQYWGDLTKYLINGPVLAFFIWLALITMSKLDVSSFAKVFGGGEVEMLQPTNFMHFILAIGFLVGGLMISSQIGGIGANWGANTVKGLGSRAGGLAKKGAMLPVIGAKKATLWAGRKADLGQRALQKSLGVKAPKSLNYRMIAQGWKAKQAEDMAKYEGYGGVHAGAVWQDTMGKYLRLGQYAGGFGLIRKRPGQRERDANDAKVLETESKNIQGRINNVLLEEDDRKNKLKEYNDNRDRIVDDYIGKTHPGWNEKEKRNWAIKEWQKDLVSLQRIDDKEDKKNIIKNYEDKIDKNMGEASKLHQAVRIGPEWFKRFAAPYEPIHVKSGAKEQVDKAYSSMKMRTGGQDFAVINELLRAQSEKDADKIVAALKLLFENNDSNEALKDSRIMNLLTKPGGYYEKLIDGGDITYDKNTISRDDALKSVISDARSNPVTPANAQALVQGVLGDVKIDKALAARYAHEIGSASFASGNGIGYGMSYGDEATGNMKFNNMVATKEGLQTNEARDRAITGKFSNLESQAKMRTVHHNSIFIEDSNGNITGLHKSGISWLKSLTSHDFSQINRLRLDMIRKAGSSAAAMKDLKKLVQDLEGTGKKEDYNQAQLIKTFAGYIKLKYEGKDITSDDKLMAAQDAFNENSAT